MILIVTHKQDFTADFVIDRLNEEGIPYKRFNCEDVDAHFYKIRFTSSLQFDVLGESKFKSVWFRRVQIPEISQSYEPSEVQFLENEYYSLFQNLFLTIDAKWLSQPTSVYAAENKLLQLKIAQSLKFKIPETLITNNRDELKSLYRTKERGVIIKALSQNKLISGENQKLIFTNKLSDSVMSVIDDFQLTPCILQEYIEKEFEIRVTIVGNEIFSACVKSQDDIETRIDWRRKRLPFFKYSLPVEIENKCINLVRALNLSFGAIDLIKSISGEYYFIEINPNGQWAWIETDTGLPITESIINFLK